MLPFDESSQISTVFHHALHTGYLTRLDEARLHQVMVSDQILSTTELHQIRVLLDRLTMGLLKVVDD